MLGGCQYLNLNKADKPRVKHRTVVTPQLMGHKGTVVSVYNLKNIGMEHASADEIEAFTGVIYDLVVTDELDKSESDVQVFGTIMTIKTNPVNHLRIEDYLNQVERAMAAK